MQPQLKAKPTSLYDTDYQLWLAQTVDQLDNTEMVEIYF